MQARAFNASRRPSVCHQRPHVAARAAVGPISYRELPAPGVPAEAPAIEVEVHATEEGVNRSLVHTVQAAAAAAIQAKGVFTLAVPGGSVLKALKGLSESKGIDWSKVHLFYVNHKCVPNDSKDSTHHKAKGLFLDACKGTHAAALNGSPDADEEARAYEKKLKQVATEIKMPMNRNGIPVFDLMLLGMGADGHVGSLYPGHPATTTTKGLVLAVKRKDPQSITLSAPVMSAAKHIVIACTGGSKAKAVHQAVETKMEPGSMPAQMVQATTPGAKLTWVLDAAAAGDLSMHRSAATVKSVLDACAPKSDTLLNDPLEAYCEENPDADECRVYQD